VLTWFQNQKETAKDVDAQGFFKTGNFDKLMRRVIGDKIF